MLRVVIDTNVLLVMVPRKSAYHWLFRAIIDEKIDVAVTNEMVAEYEEQFIKHWGKEPAEELLNVLLEAHNIIFSFVHFHFNLIKDDPDDNKFADCCIAAGCDYLITFNKHFTPLRQLEFPKINCIHPDAFEQILMKNNLTKP